MKRLRRLGASTAVVALLTAATLGWISVSREAAAQSSNPSSTMTFNATTSFVRPANTTTYTAGSLMCNTTGGTCGALTLTPTSGIELLSEVRLLKSSVGSTANTFGVMFFTGDPTLTGLHDNSALLTPAITDESKFVGAWTCTVMVTTPDSGQRSECAPSNLGPLVQHFKLTDGKLRAVVTATGAYVPASGETITLSIGALSP